MLRTAPASVALPLTSTAPASWCGLCGAPHEKDVPHTQAHGSWPRTPARLTLVCCSQVGLCAARVAARRVGAWRAQHTGAGADACARAVSVARPLHMVVAHRAAVFTTVLSTDVLNVAKFVTTVSSLSLITIPTFVESVFASIPRFTRIVA